jgi:hypothetical protein
MKFTIFILPILLPALGDLIDITRKLQSYLTLSVYLEISNLSLRIKRLGTYIIDRYYRLILSVIISIIVSMIDICGQINTHLPYKIASFLYSHYRNSIYTFIYCDC